MTVFTFFKVHSFEHDSTCIMYNTCVLCNKPFDQPKTYTTTLALILGQYRTLIKSLINTLRARNIS